MSGGGKELLVIISFVFSTSNHTHPLAKLLWAAGQPAKWFTSVRIVWQEWALWFYDAGHWSQWYILPWSAHCCHCHAIQNLPPIGKPPRSHRLSAWASACIHMSRIRQFWYDSLTFRWNSNSNVDRSRGATLTGSRDLRNLCLTHQLTTAMTVLASAVQSPICPTLQRQAKPLITGPSALSHIVR